IDGGEPGAAVVHRLEDAEGVAAVGRPDTGEHDAVEQPLHETGVVLRRNVSEQGLNVLAASPEIAYRQRVAQGGHVVLFLEERVEHLCAFRDVNAIAGPISSLAPDDRPEHFPDFPCSL